MKNKPKPIFDSVENELLKLYASRHSVKNLAKTIGKNEESIKELLHCFFGTNKKISDRAAWVLSHVADDYPEYFSIYLSDFCEIILKKTASKAQQRNTIRLMQFVPILEKDESKILDSCFSILINKSSDIASVVSSIEVASKLCSPFPELINELNLILEDWKSFSSSAIMVKISKFQTVYLKKNRYKID